MSTLLFWQGRNGRSSATNSTSSGSGTATTPGTTPSGATPGRAWLHASDLLLKGHVVYLVKFLGTTTVDQPKGIEVVKDAIRRLQFTQQLRKSETGAKTKKVEITISVDGVAIQEPRTNNILHQFPLHRISYCADDKEAKKFFSFIAKGDTAGGNNSLTNGTSPSEQSSVVNSTTDGSSISGSEQHECFVFVSNKLAAEITLTIGQAFDLAYKRFLMERGAGAEAAGQEACRARAQAQEFAARTKELAALLDASAHDQLAAWLARRGITHATDWTHTPETGTDMISSSQDKNMLPSSPPLYSTNNHIADLMNDSIDLSTPSKNPSVGTKLEGLLLNSDSDSDFDPRAAESDPPAATLAAARPRLSQNSSHNSSISTNLSSSPQGMNGGHSAPLLAPPPKATKRQSSPLQNTNGLHNGSANDLFGSAPFHASVNLIPPPTATNNINISNNALNLTPNYNLSDFNTSTSIFQTTTTSVSPPQNGGIPQNTSFSNGTSGMVGFDPFDTGKFSGIISNGNAFSNGVTNGFSNPMGVNGFSSNNGMSNGFGSPFPFGEKQNNTTLLDSSFTGFLDKRINEMKDGFGRGLIIGNEDFLVESLDPLRKN